MFGIIIWSGEGWMVMRSPVNSDVSEESTPFHPKVWPLGHKSLACAPPSCYSESLSTITRRRQSEG